MACSSKPSLLDFTGLITVETYTFSVALKVTHFERYMDCRASSTDSSRNKVDKEQKS